MFLAKGIRSGPSGRVEGNVINMVDQRVWKPTPRFFSYALSSPDCGTPTAPWRRLLATARARNAIAGAGLKSVTIRESSGASAKPPSWGGHHAGGDRTAVRFILDAPAMTGQMIALDGGQHLAWDTPDVRHASRG